MSSNRITRRRLLKTAGALAAAPYIVPSTVFGQGSRLAPSERLNVAVIGLKKMGGGHVRYLLKSDQVQLVAVCDVRADLLEKTRQQVDQAYAEQKTDGTYKGCAAYNEYERVLERNDIDAVIIATPDHWHAIIAIAACKAGKDVYCEKPLSLTIREARAMVNAARANNTVFQTGSQQRSMAEFRKACELVRNGYIGELKSAHVQVGPASTDVQLAAEPIPEGFDYDRWLGPAPLAPYNELRVGSNYDNGWRRIRDYSGGKMTDWGAHHFDIVQWALDMDNSGPVEIIPPPADREIKERGKIIDGPGAFPGEASWGLTYRYANGVKVVKDGLKGVEFVGTEGRIEVNRGRLLTEPKSLRKQELGPNEIHLPHSPGHHENWFECIRTRQKPIADVEIGARSATVCHLGCIALWEDRTIHWDPEKEAIIGDEKAAKWLDREKRKPYVMPT